MATPEERLAVMETNMEHVRNMLEEIRGDVKALNDGANRRRGALTVIGAAAGIAGAVVTSAAHKVLGL